MHARNARMRPYTHIYTQPFRARIGTYTSTNTNSRTDTLMQNVKLLQKAKDNGTTQVRTEAVGEDDDRRPGLLTRKGVARRGGMRARVVHMRVRGRARAAPSRRCCRLAYGGRGGGSLVRDMCTPGRAARGGRLRLRVRIRRTAAATAAAVAGARIGVRRR